MLSSGLSVSPHLCTSALELIFGDDEFGHDAEHASTLKHSRTLRAVLDVDVMLHNVQNVPHTACHRNSDRRNTRRQFLDYPNLSLPPEQFRSPQMKVKGHTLLTVRYEGHAPAGGRRSQPRPSPCCDGNRSLLLWSSPRTRCRCRSPDKLSHG